MNHSPVASLANKAPLELFTGLSCPSPLRTLFVPGHQPRPVILSSEPIEQSLTSLRSSIMEMHREVSDKREKITLLNKKRSSDAQEANFSVGDYVLRSRVDEKFRNKLMVTWIGPYVVTRADTHSFRVKHLVTGDEQDVHASRLKFYADQDLEVNEELLEHISAQGILLKVGKLAEHRWSDAIKDYELFVSWCGLEEIENLWEPLSPLTKDVKVLVSAYIDMSGDEDLKTHFKQATA
ncbi:hypothetical protein PI124_g16066 [Phytophthora idaei]|nr:hypothetical protein PI124_g16066 [Phytophthora idaei]